VKNVLQTNNEQETRQNKRKRRVIIIIIIEDMQDSLEDTDLINATRGILSTLDPGLSSSSHHVA
jgi:hypothetical protein